MSELSGVYMDEAKPYKLILKGEQSTEGWIVVDLNTNLPIGLTSLVGNDPHNQFPFRTSKPNEIHFFTTYSKALVFSNKAFDGYDLRVARAGLVVSYKVKEEV